MRKSSIREVQELEHSVGVLARVATKDKSVKIELPEQPKALSENEILMAVVVGGSIRVKKAQALSPSVKIEKYASRLIELESTIMELARMDELPTRGRVAALTEGEENVLKRGGFDLTAVPPGT